MLDRFDAMHWSSAWIEKAQRNMEKWGDEGVRVLILCIMEELGELSQAHLQREYEDKPRERILAEIDDLAALVYQIRYSYECE